MADNKLRSSLDRIKSKDRNKMRFILARVDSDNITECCESIGVSRQWYYKLSDEDRAEIEECVIDLRDAKVYQAMLVLESAAVTAARVLVNDLDDNDRRAKNLRQAAAKDILDRLGASDKVERVEHRGRVTAQIDVAAHLARVYGSDHDIDSDYVAIEKLSSEN